MNKPHDVQGNFAYGIFKTMAPAAATNGVLGICMCVHFKRQKRLEMVAVQEFEEDFQRCQAAETAAIQQSALEQGCSKKTEC